MVLPGVFHAVIDRRHLLIPLKQKAGMLKEITSERFKNGVLDGLLEKGWFRMYDTMFTTSTIQVAADEHDIFWFRYDVHRINYGRRQKDIINKNKNFTLRYQPLILTEEMEQLFAIYKDSKPFVGYHSLVSAFISGIGVFDTWVVTVRDEHKRLIAIGFFDKGTESIAGIMNAYHPEYEKYSPGKFLLLAKIYFCRRNKLRWYYPGYIMKPPSRFDYKLFPDKAASQVYTGGVWAPYNEWAP